MILPILFEEAALHSSLEDTMLMSELHDAFSAHGWEYDENYEVLNFPLESAGLWINSIRVTIDELGSRIFVSTELCFSDEKISIVGELFAYMYGVTEAQGGLWEETNQLFFSLRPVVIGNPTTEEYVKSVSELASGLVAFVEKACPVIALLETHNASIHEVLEWLHYSDEPGSAQ